MEQPKRKIKRAEKRNAPDTNAGMQPVGKQSRRSTSKMASEIVSKCFFCNETTLEGMPLHKVMTFNLDSRVRQAAKDTNNRVLYAKLQKGDMCAQDALYHATCLCKLYREANKAKFGAKMDEIKRNCHDLAFS